jgi:hypothetical protein
MSPRVKRVALCRVFLQFRSPQWKRASMAPPAAYLITLALMLLVLVVLWEGL